MTASEQRLALGLGAVVVLGGAFIGLTKLRAWKQTVDIRSVQMETRRVEAEDLLAQKDFWNQRFTWLGEKQPLFTSRGDVDNKFLDQLTASANEYGIDLDQTQPIEPSERAGIVSSTFTIQATASWEDMNRWLHALQKPESYISIPTLTMSPKDDDTTMVTVNMNIQKWFRLPL
jgi:alpha-beta hydrolase superfamily lysophospholipase